jgi:hypothetical protein
MATAEYTFAEREDAEPARLGMAAQLLVVALGTLVALLVGVLLVLVATS